LLGGGTKCAGAPQRTRDDPFVNDSYSWEGAGKFPRKSCRGVGETKEMELSNPILGRNNPGKFEKVPRSMQRKNRGKTKIGIVGRGKRNIDIVHGFAQMWKVPFCQQKKCWGVGGAKPQVWVKGLGKCGEMKKVEKPKLEFAIFLNGGGETGLGTEEEAQD